MVGKVVFLHLSSSLYESIKKPFHCELEGLTQKSDCQ